MTRAYVPPPVDNGFEKLVFALEARSKELGLNSLIKMVEEDARENKYQNIHIPPGLGNKYFHQFYIDAPTRIVLVENMDFKFNSDSLVFDTGAHIRYPILRDDGCIEVRLKLAEVTRGVNAVYILINSGNSKSIYSSEKIGEIVLFFEDTLKQSTELVLGKNIREWRIGVTGNFIRENTDAHSKKVWEGLSKDGTFAVIDCLKIEIPTYFRSHALEEIAFIHRNLQKYGDTLGPQFFVSGVNLELKINADE